MFRTEVLQRVRMLSLRFLSRASWPAFAVIVCARERIGQAGVLRACSWNLAEFDKLLEQYGLDPTLTKLTIGLGVDRLRCACAV
jgi:hypothetical protein